MTNIQESVLNAGIVKVLEQHGFSENQDFMFISMNDQTDFVYDGVPMYRITNSTTDKESFYSETLKRNITVNVINDFNMGKTTPDGQTSDNNSVYAVYVPYQGFVFTKNPKIKQLMEQEFQFKDTHFGIPLSNGGKFRDEKKQNAWKKILLQNVNNHINKETSNQQSNTVIMRAAANHVMDK